MRRTPGSTGRASRRSRTSADSGVRFARADYERDGKLRVTEVLSLSPAALAGIAPATTCCAMDGARIDARTQRRFAAHVSRRNRRVTLSVSRSRRRHRRARGRGSAGERGDRARARLSRLGREPARLRREGQQRAARLRPHAGHGPGLADAALPRSRHGESRPRRRRDRHPQQQRRLRESVRDRRLRAARLSAVHAARLRDGARPLDRSASARSRSRRCS